MEERFTGGYAQYIAKFPGAECMARSLEHASNRIPAKRFQTSTLFLFLARLDVFLSIILLT